MHVVALAPAPPASQPPRMATAADVLQPTPAPADAPLPTRRVASIAGLAAALPGTTATSADTAERLGVDENWIVKRTGIRERRVTAPGSLLSDLAADAGAAALADAGIDAADLDLVLVASVTQDTLMPGAAPVVAHRLGAVNAGTMDIGAACTGFVSGLVLATAMIESGRGERVLVIGADVFHRYTDQDDRRTAPLMGDGAGAVVVTADDSPGAEGVGAHVLGSDGRHAQLVRLPRDGVLAMEGQETFKEAVARLTEVTHGAVEAQGLTLDDVALFVYHQANARILQAVRERLGVDADRVMETISTTGNTCAATVPIALEYARREGRLRPGAYIVLAAFGSGLTFGATVVRWHD